MNKKKILKSFEFLYKSALKKDQLHIALRAKEMQGQAIGIFRHRPLPPAKSFVDMTEQELKDFIARLEENDPTLRQKK